MFDVGHYNYEKKGLFDNIMFVLQKIPAISKKASAK